MERLLIRPVRFLPVFQALTPMCLECEVLAANEAVSCGLVSTLSFRGRENQEWSQCYHTIATFWGNDISLDLY